MGEAPIFVITGQIAAGKTTLAVALLDRFDLGLHVDVDGVREMVVSGRASPLVGGPETERQFRLAGEASAQLAGVYHADGFAVAIEGAIDPWHMQQMLVDLGLWEHTVGVELFPPLDVALERNRTRETKDYDTSIVDGAIRSIHSELERKPPPAGWLRLDNSGESVDGTVDRILAGRSS